MVGIRLPIEREDHVHVFIGREKNKIIPRLCVDKCAKCSGERILGGNSLFVQCRNRLGHTKAEVLRGNGEVRIRLVIESLHPRTLVKYEIGVIVAEKKTTDLALSIAPRRRSEGSIQNNFILNSRPVFSIHVA